MSEAKVEASAADAAQMHGKPKAGIGAYIAFIIAVVMFSGVFQKNPAGWEWLSAFDFSTLIGKFGSVASMAAGKATTFVGKGYMGARGGFVAPDEITFNYIKGREYAPKGEEWDKAVAYWKTLKSGDDAVFDKELTFDAADIEPRITYGTNPGMGIGITECVPTLDTIPETGKAGFLKSLGYMGLEPGEKLLGHPIDYVFLGACTNGRIEDFRAFASLVKGRRKAEHVIAWLVPGSWAVDRQIREEGLDKVLETAGFEIRQPGCSACLAMNDDKIPAGKYSVSTSNRNFEGRQGPGARTILASPLVAAAAAVTGVITDPRELLS